MLFLYVTMKHTKTVTIILIATFILAQMMGLWIVSKYLDYKTTVATGTANFTELPYGIERPEIEQNYTFIYILIGVILGTLLLLALIKFKKTSIWKLWYAFAIIIALSVAFSGFIDRRIALLIAIAIAYFRIYKPNVYVNNISELFIYGGIAAIFVPIINIFSGIMLLVLISVYDAYAVWKSKHMVQLANFQSESKLFAGLMIPYKAKDFGKIKSSESKKVEKSSELKIDNKKSGNIAILGGGDIAFPLLFGGVIMKFLAEQGYSFFNAFLGANLITIGSAIALTFLLIRSEKGKFYPAMPFISAGCFIGLIAVLLIF
jgi:presenilin-like A22 family membrane protease